MKSHLRCLVAGLGSWLAASGVAGGQEPARILVVPFENVTRDSRILWLSEAAAVLLADDLNALGARAITRDERRVAFDRLQVPPAAALTDATIIRIGELVGATEIVAGTLQLEGDDLVVEVRRIELDTARAQRFPPQRGAVHDLLVLFEGLARLLARTSVPEEAVRFDRPPVAAFESYIKGLVAETPATAIGYLSAALLADPGFVRARLALWDAYTGQGDHERALAAVRLVPGDAPLGRRARFLTGLSYLDLLRYDDASSTLKDLAEVHASASVLNNLGVVELRRGGPVRTGNAAYYFRRATEVDANHPDSFFNLGYASWLDGDYRAATHWLREAVRRNPADGDAHFLLGEALVAAGSEVEGHRERELARRLSSIYDEWDRSPGPSQIPDDLERVRQDVELPGARHVEEALAAAGQRDQRELAGFYLDRARRALEQSRDREALDDLNRALFLDPYQADAHLLVARVHLRGGRTAEAFDALKISLWSAETAEAHAVLAEAYLEEQDLVAARAAAERALALDPNSRVARRVLDAVDATPQPPR